MGFILIIFTLVSSLAGAKPEHRHHEAHVHGAGKMSIAFDGLKGRIEFDAAAESILGFEYQPKTQKDKDILAKSTQTFKDNFSDLVQFEPTLGCITTVDKVEQKKEDPKSNHSDFKASYDVVCKKSVLNSKFKFNFSKFELLKDVDVTILVDQLQKNLEISNKESSVDLK